MREHQSSRCVSRGVRHRRNHPCHRPSHFCQTPTEFHPEFGYIWPAAHNRRLMRIALTSTAAGALFGIIVALVMTSRADPDVARTATALSVAPAPAQEPAIVGPASAPISRGRYKIPRRCQIMQRANLALSRQQMPQQRDAQTPAGAHSQAGGASAVGARASCSAAGSRNHHRGESRGETEGEETREDVQAPSRSRSRVRGHGPRRPLWGSATPMRRLIRRVTKRGGLLGAGDIAAS